MRPPTEVDVGMAGKVRLGDLIGGKYRVDGVLGSGGMGTVLRCHHVLLERASEVLAGVDEVPLPTEAQNETQLTILDIGWEAGQLLATDCWLAEAVHRQSRRSLGSPHA